MGRFIIFTIACTLALSGAFNVQPLSAAAGDFELSRDDRFLMKYETIQTINRLKNNHYKRQGIDELDAEEIVVDFMRDLDTQHLFFLQSDKEELLARFNATLIPVYLKQGDLHPAFEIFERYKERALARIEWINQRLEEDFDFESDRSYVPDRSELDWPADMAEADGLWDRRLTFELLAELLNDEPIERAKDKIVRRYSRTERYINDIEISNVQEMFLANLSEMYDPHSTYLSADSMEEFAIAMQNQLVGIGALLRDEDGYSIIQELIPGGPAELSGRLHPGDKIVEVGQEGEEPVSVVDMKIRKVVKQIRGEEGTNVYLTIVPAGSDLSNRRVIKLVRDTVKLTEKLAQATVYEVPVGDRTLPIGVIDLPSFYGSGTDGRGEASTSQDVEELLFKLMEMEVQGIVLDLRRNGGGLLNEAVALTGLFIERGPVVQIRDHIGRVREDWDRDERIVYTGPLAVLVSRRSASASEIVAGALQNHGRAIVVGDESTHGKGTVQAIYDFNNGRRFFLKSAKGHGAAKITIQKFYLPNGDSTQNKGVLADIALPSANAFLPIGESDLPHAMTFDTIQGLNFDASIGLPEEVIVSETLNSQLLDLSLSRQSYLEEFQYLNRSINWFKERQEIDSFSLNLDVRKTQRESDDALREELDAVYDSLSSERYDSTPVLLRVAENREDSHQEKLRNSKLPDGRSRENQYYQHVFYYLNPKDEIREIRVESFDYEKILRDTEEVTATLAEALGNPELPVEAVESVLKRLRSADRTEEYRTEALFEEELAGHLPEGYDMNALTSAFFLKLIEIDPIVADDQPGLDIHLRESLRILADWNLLSAGEELVPIAKAPNTELSAHTENHESTAPAASQAN